RFGPSLENSSTFRWIARAPAHGGPDQEDDRRALESSRILRSVIDPGRSCMEVQRGIVALSSTSGGVEPELGRTQDRRRRHDVLFLQSDAPGLDRAVARPVAARSEPGVATDDSELFGRLQRGDPEARATVFALYEPMVRRLLSRILRDDSDVADALQDTFVKVFRSAPQVREREAL